MGLVQEIFDEEALARLPGVHAIGHVRYSTTGSSVLKNAQPFYRGHGPRRDRHRPQRQPGERRGGFAGDLECRRQHLPDHQRHRGHRPSVCPQPQGEAGRPPRRRPASRCREPTAWSCSWRSASSRSATPTGFGPSCCGKVKDAYVVASETCALDLIEGEYIREVEPGEVVMISGKGLETLPPLPRRAPQAVRLRAHLLRPPRLGDLRPPGVPRARGLRARVGPGAPRGGGRRGSRARLRASWPPWATPRSPASRSPWGSIRNHYVGRTFIEPEQSIRHFGVKLKLNAVRGVLQGKRVVVVDDSIVRGTTSRKIVKMVREAGARGGAHAHLLAAHVLPLLLRHRHPHPQAN